MTEILRSVGRSHLENNMNAENSGDRERLIKRFPTGQNEGVGNNRWSGALINIKAQRLPDVGYRLGQALLMWPLSRTSHRLSGVSYGRAALHPPLNATTLFRNPFFTTSQTTLGMSITKELIIISSIVFDTIFSQRLNCSID